MNTPRQVYSLAAMFADQDQAKRVFTTLESTLKALRFDAHVSRIMVKEEMYVSFLHEGPESSIPAPVMQAVRQQLSQGQQLGPLPPEVVANIQARRAQRRAQGIGQYESHEPTLSTYQWPAIQDSETKEILAEYYDQGQIVTQEPYTSPDEEEQKRREQAKIAQARQTAHGSTPAAELPQRRQGAPGKPGKPLIERYLTYLRLAQENARARLHDKSGLTRDQHNFNLLLMTSYHDTYSRMARKALKYRLAASAQNMIDVLRPRPLLLEDITFAIMADIGSGSRELDSDIATPIVTVPAAPIWLELEEPVSTNTGEIAGIFFACSDREVEQMLASERQPGMRSVLEASARRSDQPYRWSLHFIYSDGTPTTRYEYDETARAWSIIPGRLEEELCPTGECKQQDHGDGTYAILPCAFCGTILAYWRSWMVTALLTVQGELAATETAEWPHHQEQTTRKVKRPNSAKYDEIKVTHDYYLVSFDASVKRVTPEQPPEDEHEVTPRGSWVAAAQEIDPASVVYVRHDFGKSQRRLDPERNPRWKAKRTVEIRPYSKRVPMRVDHLQHKITRVIASRFEQHKDPAQGEQKGENGYV